MGTVILISTAAILVAIVGCAVIWRLDAARADEIEHTPRPEARAPGSAHGHSLPPAPSPPP